MSYEIYSRVGSMIHALTKSTSSLLSGSSTVQKFKSLCLNDVTSPPKPTARRGESGVRHLGPRDIIQQKVMNCSQVASSTNRCPIPGCIGPLS